MKKFLLTLLLASSAMAGIAQNYNPAVNSGTISPAPIVNGFATCQFNVGNTGNDALTNLAQPMVLIITLSYGVPNNADPIAAIGGTYAGRFNWLYDPVTRTYQGTQNQVIPSFGLGTITIAYKATQPSIPLNPQNGFNVNVIPPAYTNASNASGDDNVSSYTYGNTPIIVPVKLTSYEVTVSNCVTTVNWKSATEENFKHYEVEYSSDGIRFQTISTTAGKGENYSYSIKHNPAQGKAYYRLKMVDIDDKREYSRTVVLDIQCSKSSVSVFPNPASLYLNVNIAGSDAKGTMASLISTSGQVVLTRNLQNGNTQLDVSRFAPGIYNLRLVNNFGTQNVKVIID